MEIKYYRQRRLYTAEVFYSKKLIETFINIDQKTLSDNWLIDSIGMSKLSPRKWLLKMTTINYSSGVNVLNSSGKFIKFKVFPPLNDKEKELVKSIDWSVKPIEPEVEIVKV